LYLRREAVDILHDHCHSLVLRKLFAGTDQEVPVKTVTGQADGPLRSAGS
jgi:hypothetical protein